MEQALCVSGLNKKIKRRQILSDINLQVGYGEAMGLIGANGAGKTSLIKCLADLWHADSGEVFICGNNIKTNFEQAMKDTGFMIEYPKLFGELSPFQNLEYISTFNSENITKEQIANLVEQVGLKDFINKKLKTFSSGMYQRICFAVILLHKPKLLILDEPTAMLDPKSVVDFRNILIEIKEKTGVAMVISSHNLHEVEKLCDRVTIIDKGKILGVKNINETENKYIKLEFADEETAKKALELLQTTQNLTSKTENKTIVFNGTTDILQKFMVVCPYKIINIRVEETLENDFLTILNGDKQL